MKKIIPILFCCCLFVFAASAQPINIPQLDSFFNTFSRENMAMGSVAVALNGQLVYQRAIGPATMENGKTISANTLTRYRIGSVSKLFTAALIFQLIDKGTLQLDQKLSVFFPDLPNASTITIANMLNHHSGLHDYTHDTNFPQWMDQPKTHAQLLQIIKSKGSDFAPGDSVNYCNTNFLLLGYILEKMYKKDYAQVLQQQIIIPLQLHHTRFGKPINIAQNESVSYKYGDSAWKKEKETNNANHNGAGAIVSIPADMVRFINALFTGKLIGNASLKKMISMTDGYGMGIFPFDHNNSKGYGHDGRIEEFYSSVRYFPDKKLAIAYCTNGILYPRNDIIKAVRNIAFNENYSIPFTASMVTDTALAKYIGKYTSADLPFAVNCTMSNKQLVLEASGKTMTVIPIATNYFMHRASGSFFEFYPETGELEIKETSNVYYLKRQ